MWGEIYVLKRAVAGEKHWVDRQNQSHSFNWPHWKFGAEVRCLVLRQVKRKGSVGQISRTLWWRDQGSDFKPSQIESCVAAMKEVDIENLQVEKSAKNIRIEVRGPQEDARDKATIVDALNHLGSSGSITYGPVRKVEASSLLG